MPETTERPLVTFAVIAYNQEPFIREAIEGAFAQTYHPLEIILSDDCSSDRTYQIMQEMTAAYDGPHKVVLNRNEPNLGIVPHIDRVMDLVRGEFIVANAGDDVSLPERTCKLVDVWWKAPGTISLVHSKAEKFDDENNFLGYRCPPVHMRGAPKPCEIIEYASHVVGATAGWDRRVFDKFGPLAPGLEIEDHIIPFRASLIGELSYIDLPLVKNRVGGISGRDDKSRAYDYLYGSGNRSRKWIAETDKCFLTRFCGTPIEGRWEKEEICRRRHATLDFSVGLAEASRMERFLILPYCISLSKKLKSFQWVKDYLRYNFDFVYI